MSDIMQTCNMDERTNEEKLIELNDILRVELAAANERIKKLESSSIPILNGKPEITNRMKRECIGEFTFEIPSVNEYDEECQFTVYVPLDTCKEIYKKMAAVAITSKKEDI